MLSTNPANSGQHPLSGFFNLLPSSTNVKQSDMFVIAAKQTSADGGAAPAPSGDGAPTEAGDSAGADTPLDASDAKIKEIIATTMLAVAI